MTTVSYDDFAKLDLRVAKIIATESIEGKSRIIKGRIDLGGNSHERCAQLQFTTASGGRCAAFSIAEAQPAPGVASMRCQSAPAGAFESSNAAHFPLGSKQHSETNRPCSAGTQQNLRPAATEHRPHAHSADSFYR